MKGLLHSIRTAAAVLGLAALFACPHSVRAQDAARGTFVLPFAVQWQGKTLPAGEYSFRLPSAGFGKLLIIRDAQNHGKMLVVIPSKDHFSGPSIITIVQRRGKRYVSSLGLNSIGARWEFPVPAQKAEQLTEASIQIIFVQTGS